MTSLIIVDYKSMHKTIEYIEHCNQMIVDSNDLHIIIVDNCEDSTIGRKIFTEKYESQFTQLKQANIEQRIYQTKVNGKEILYVCAEKNLGYAKGNNLGAKVAKDYYQDSYYLFSNNDLKISKPMTLKTFSDIMNIIPNVAVVGPEILDREGRPQSPRKYVKAWNKLFLYYFDLLLPKNCKLRNMSDIMYPTESIPCYWVTGSFLFVHANRFQLVEGFDEHTFLYYEEAILAERLRKQGYRMYFDKTYTIVHEHGQTVKNVMSVLEGIKISFQSSIYYYTKYRKLSLIVRILAEINFYFFEVAFLLKKKIGMLCKRYIKTK